MMLGNLPVTGRPAIWIIVEQGHPRLQFVRVGVAVIFIRHVLLGFNHAKM